MSAFRIEGTRGALVESRHAVSAAVVDAGGRLLAHAGKADLVTFWRSAAKPFQALPLLADGVADRFGLGSEELALACASHSSEPPHLAVARRFLERIGCGESDLACGPHPPLGAAVADEVIRRGITMTPCWSNCSGKHAGMLALARHHGWPTAGYERAGHPVQERILREVSAWTGLEPGSLALAIDGCTAACFGLPLRAMALAYARFAADAGAATTRLRGAMAAHPGLVAGTGRFDSDVIRASGGRILAKIGAEGVYGACIVPLGLGVAVKVEDGDMRSAPVALAAILLELLRRAQEEFGEARGVLERSARTDIRNTRGELTGELAPAGDLQYSASARATTISAPGGMERYS